MLVPIGAHSLAAILSLSWRQRRLSPKTNLWFMSLIYNTGCFYKRTRVPKSMMIFWLTWLCVLVILNSHLVKKSLEKKKFRPRRKLLLILSRLFMSSTKIMANIWTQCAMYRKAKKNFSCFFFLVASYCWWSLTYIQYKSSRAHYPGSDLCDRTSLLVTDCWFEKLFFSRQTLPACIAHKSS